MGRKKNIVLISISVLVLFFLFWALGLFYGSQPIKVGLVGTVTGPSSDWGITCRNGIHFAIEEVNQTGGIKGRLVELITKDVQEYKDNLNAIVDELLAEGVVAAIGPFFSSTAVKMVPYSNRKNLLLFSPSASTDVLKGADDLFFRCTMAKGHDMPKLATFLFEERGFRYIRVVYDESNRAYSENFYKGVEETFVKLGGHMDLAATVSDGKGHVAAAQKLLGKESDAVFIVAGGIDTAILSQELRKADSNLPIIGSGWAMTEDLTQKGGAAVEGMVMVSKFVDDPKNKKFPVMSG